MKDIKYKHTLIVREKMEQALANVGEVDRDPIITCCCYNQGFSTMTTNFEKTIYMPHETARATAHINNTECKLDCTRVAFAVEMHSSMQIHHDHFSNVYKHAESHDPLSPTGAIPRHHSAFTTPFGCSLGPPLS